MSDVDVAKQVNQEVKSTRSADVRENLILQSISLGVGAH